MSVGQRLPALYPRAMNAAMAGRSGLLVLVNAAGLLGSYALVAITLNGFAMRGEGQEILPLAE